MTVHRSPRSANVESYMRNRGKTQPAPSWAVGVRPGSASVAALGQQREQPRRSHRELENGDPEPGERILDRVGDGRRGGDGAAPADALAAEGGEDRGEIH